MNDQNKPLTYISYLRLDELLALQRPRSDGPEHDEMLFIVIHQVYELWFKQVLHELRHLRHLFEANDSTAALSTLKRVLTILKTLVAQVDVIETMTPMSFTAFRDRLERLGHAAVRPANPYWQGRALTFADPDGWHVVLCPAPLE